LRHALRSSAKRPRAIPPDIATLTLLSSLSLSLSLSSRALHTLSKSTHQTPAAEFPRERCASYPKIQIPILRPENSNQLGRVICPFDTPDNTRTAGPNSRSRKFQPIGEICLPFWHPGQYQNSRSPIRGPENFNQLGRVARHFDTPDNNTRAPGPNSMFRKFEPIGESYPPFWHPGHYKTSRSQFDVPTIPTNWVELPAILEPRTAPELQVPMPSLNERFLLGQILTFFSQNNWIFFLENLCFFNVNSTIYFMGIFCQDFQYHKIEGKKAIYFFFLVQNFTQMRKINMKGECYITIFLFL
jgi:hypothetical protein